ncbi:MAG: hypothetical protein ACREOE_05635, partial [Gemmatimonadales bacterium]
VENLAVAELLAMEAERSQMTGGPDSASAVRFPAPPTEDSAPAFTAVPQPRPQESAAVASAPAPALMVGVTADHLAAALALLQGTGIATGAAVPADVASAPEEEEEGEILAPLEPPTLTHLSKAEAIRIAIKRRPDYTAVQIVDVLAGYDVTVSADYVRQVKARDEEAAAKAAADTDREETHGAVVQIRKSQ